MTISTVTLSVLDAVGKPGSNLLNGQVNWVGSYEECLSAQAQVNRSGEIIHPFEGQYCTAYLKTTKVESRLILFVLTAKHNHNV